MSEYIKYVTTGGIVQSEILNAKSTFVLVSFWWGRGNKNRGSVKNLTYDQQVDRIISCCRKLSINYYFVEFPAIAEKGLYQIALGLKGEFINYCLDKFPNHKVIFIDTDMQILKYPYLFEIDADCFFVNWGELDAYCYDPLQVELPGAILGFANTHNARTLLNITRERQLKALTIAEDKFTSVVISHDFLNTYLRCVWLPENYLFMFDKHKYSPEQKRYTYVSKLHEEVKRNRFDIKDVVMIHEDFETGALDDVYDERVGKDRFPKNFNKDYGAKLRCMQNKFFTYIDWVYNKKQMQQMMPDLLYREKYKVIKLKTIKQPEQLSISKNFKLIKQVIHKNSRFVIVTYADSETEASVVDNFISHCEQQRLSYIVLRSKQPTVSIPLLILALISKLNKNVVYMNINTVIKKYPKLFDVKNMDFMTFNMNDQYWSSGCSDMRVLKTLNNNCYYVANNDVAKGFLKIWQEYNTKNYTGKYLGLQHKSCEYAFNVSLAINFMRCYWIPKDYLTGPIIIQKGDVSLHTYTGISKKVKHVTKQLEQCGLKPALNEESYPVRAHFFGSKHGAIHRDRYRRMFLEF